MLIQEFYTEQEQRESIKELLKEANINMSVDEFIKVYASNRGIKTKNVMKNIVKWQLYLPGNYKYLLRILNDELNFLVENPKE